MVQIEHRVPEDDIREDCFVKKILSNACEAPSIVIICGDLHVQALKRKLEAHGHKVETDEILVTDKRWV